MHEYSAVCQLFARLAAGMDAKDPALTTAAFASNGRFEVSLRGREVVPPIEGRHEIGEFFAAAGLRQNDQRRHVITNIRTSDTDGESVAYAYLGLFVTADGGAASLKQTGVFRSAIVEEAGKLCFAVVQLALDGPASG